MSGEPSPTTLTDDEDDIITETMGVTPRPSSHQHQGILSKWTNYIHGWQDRFIILKDGTLSYYRSEQELSFGCRGSISILKAKIRVSVSLNTLNFFNKAYMSLNYFILVLKLIDAWFRRREIWSISKWLRLVSQSIQLGREDKVGRNFGAVQSVLKLFFFFKRIKNWYFLNILLLQNESGYGSESSLQRHGSAVSISSNTLSTTSGSSFRKGRGLRVKLAELETYRDILIQQIDKLQKYFDACASNGNLTESSSMSSAGILIFTQNQFHGLIIWTRAYWSIRL